MLLLCVPFFETLIVPLEESSKCKQLISSIFFFYGRKKICTQKTANRLTG